MRISAHTGPTAYSGQPGLSGMAAYRQAVATNADYVELDVRRTADGELVAFHDPCTGQGQPLSAIGYPRLCELAGYEVPRVRDVLTELKGRAKGHLDLKEVNGGAEVIRLALDVLGPGEFLVTSPQDATVAAIRTRFPDPGQVPVALTLGRGMRGEPRLAWLRTRASELWPAPRLEACAADWAAIDHRLALAGTARRCRRKRRKVMVWTVNSELEIRYWLRRRIDVLVTDRPALAVALRDRPRYS